MRHLEHDEESLQCHLHRWIARGFFLAGVALAVTPSMAADCGKISGIKASDLTMTESGPGGVPKIDAGALFQNVIVGNKKALPALRRCAEHGDEDAMGLLGMYYLDRDDVEAMKWFRRSADGGNASALCTLAISGYGKGKGVPKNSKEEMRLTAEAAVRGDSRCQYNVGMAYMLGEGLREDHPEAVKWWRKAAEQGLPIAQKNLGLAYEKGDGIAKDWNEARRWYGLAAANPRASEEDRAKAARMRQSLKGP
jgi:TPR repeat protein